MLAVVDETSNTVTKRVRRHRERKERRKQRDWRYYQRAKERRITTRLSRAHTFIDYDGFVLACIARRKQLGWSQKDLDAIAGWPDGYCSKLEAWRGSEGRTAGGVAMGLWLAALGIAFVPVVAIEGSLGEQSAKLAAIQRPKLDGAEIQRTPKSGRRSQTA